jgi:hypothetical protein
MKFNLLTTKADPSYRLRLPAEMKTYLEEVAAMNARSLNAQILFYLANSLVNDSQDQPNKLIPEVDKSSEVQALLLVRGKLKVLS